MRTDLKAQFPHLAGVEIRKLGEYMERRITGADFLPETGVVFHRKLKEAERQRLLGFLDGLNEANLWADEPESAEVAA